ncbi:MAG: hypothetical protein FJ164_08015 [Gammaproteobacteria bacterium]|nr:hypothetical protein [Gammaproteobacteria bacterium]
MHSGSAWLSGFWGKLAVSLLAIVTGVVLFTFSLVVLAVFLAFGLIVWAWLMWRTRGIRRQLREQMEDALRRSADSADGAVIEGEYTEVSRVVREIAHEPADRER